MKNLSKQLALVNIENIKKDKSKNIIKNKLIGKIKIREQLLKDFPPKELRGIIDQETYELQINSRAGIDILFGSDKQPKIGPLLDPEKEKERIEKLQ